MAELVSVPQKETLNSPVLSYSIRSRVLSSSSFWPTNQPRDLRSPGYRKDSARTEPFPIALPSPPLSESEKSSSPKFSFRYINRAQASRSLSDTSPVNFYSAVSCVQNSSEADGISFPSSPYVDECNELISQAELIQTIDSFPFPVQPTTYQECSISSIAKDQKSKKQTKRYFSTVTTPFTPPSTPDRYISSRDASQSPLKRFRLSKSPDKLSVTERLLRQHSTILDPFSSAFSTQVRGDRPNLLFDVRSPNLVRTGAISGASVLGVSRDHPSIQSRGASIGAVWNVGGSSATTSSGPIQGITDGRGGMIGSGTNAPMYTSNFLHGRSFAQDHDRLEGRIAIALDINQTSRILNTSQPAERGRRVNVDHVGTKRKPLSLEPRTQWIDGEWVREDTPSLLDAPQLRDDFYCSVLAYCHTARTLAVGLRNNVYLWSESFGVQVPQMEEASGQETYVSSLSFSSVEAGHSILAIGRNNGRVNLWSLYDEHGTRFHAKQPSAISCVAFKPVATRRPSERFGSPVFMEDLLVGDESGMVNYYSVEWMSNQQVDIHGWQGAMNLIAKINVHHQQICGLAWSHDGEYFATGANDNLCCLFEVKDILTPPNQHFGQAEPPREPHLTARFEFQNSLPSSAMASKPMSFRRLNPQALEYVQTLSGYTGSSDLPIIRRKSILGHHGILEISEGRQKHKWIHSAAIKAIAFCPWQRGLLATGGGTNDRAIHFYHTFSGACLATIDVQAQVTSLIWSTSRREIAATFGYAQPDHPYRIAVFSWPDCKQVVAIPWGTDMRALLAIPYPGGPNEVSRQVGEGGTWWSRTSEEGCIVVACSDESVKFHEVWSGAGKATGGHIGLLGGSDILEGLEGIDKEGTDVIR